MGWEGKEELKPRISAICKISFEPFSKSHSRKRTRKHSANKGLPIFWGWVFFPLQEYGKCPVLYPYLLIFSIFTDHLHRKIMFLSQVSHEETNASCSQNQKAIQPVIIHGNHCSRILSGETSKTEKDIKFCSRTCTKLLWIPILAYQDPLNKFCLLCLNPIQSLSGSLSSERTHWGTHTCSLDLQFSEHTIEENTVHIQHWK